MIWQEKEKKANYHKIIGAIMEVLTNILVAQGREQSQGWSAFVHFILQN